MNIPVNPDTERLVKEQVESGRYRSAAEVIEDAVRLLTERGRKLEQLRKEIQVGVDQIERGEYTEYDAHTIQNLFSDIEAEGLRKLAAKRKSGQ
ncbi:MAG: type II toxin-antitoxin system ParD family antitoxin [Acidobacteria bacterium]|nr:type II toxin-antitoxin system ParD family antitoxin [Acidobacteriota bacterium]